ncbi:MAG: hypothetical protein WB524_25940 [Acidobacteriaceae bacterium]
MKIATNPRKVSFISVGLSLLGGVFLGVQYRNHYQSRVCYMPDVPRVTIASPDLEGADVNEIGEVWYVCAVRSEECSDSLDTISDAAKRVHSASARFIYVATATIPRELLTGLRSGIEVEGARRDDIRDFVAGNNASVIIMNRDRKVLYNGRWDDATVVEQLKKLNDLVRDGPALAISLRSDVQPPIFLSSDTAFCTFGKSTNVVVAKVTVTAQGEAMLETFREDVDDSIRERLARCIRSYRFIPARYGQLTTPTSMWIEVESGNSS